MQKHPKVHMSFRARALARRTRHPFTYGRRLGRKAVQSVTADSIPAATERSSGSRNERTHGGSDDAWAMAMAPTEADIRTTQRYAALLLYRSETNGDQQRTKNGPNESKVA